MTFIQFSSGQFLGLTFSLLDFVWTGLVLSLTFSWLDCLSAQPDLDSTLFRLDFLSVFLCFSVFFQSESSCEHKHPEERKGWRTCQTWSLSMCDWKNEMCRIPRKEGLWFVSWILQTLTWSQWEFGETLPGLQYGWCYQGSFGGWLFPHVLRVLPATKTTSESSSARLHLNAPSSPPSSIFFTPAFLLPHRSVSLQLWAQENDDFNR